MKYNNILKHIALWCLLPMAWVGCTDWDEHYDVEGELLTAEYTLWEEIVSRPELRDFMECLEAYGYKEKLNGAQMYTVFAPVGKLDTANLTRKKIEKEVIENHIARFAHSANGATKDKSIIMLNDKVVNFTQVGEEFLFGGKKLTKEYNIRAKNGVLHVIEGQQPFFHNIWEYLTTDARFDNIRNYLYSFNDTILDENKSIKGEINDKGQQEYLDSVVYISNSLFYSIGRLDDEDSTYTMIVPTNEAWDEAYDRVENYYVYSNKVAKRDSLKKHYSNLAVLQDLVFSHTEQRSMEDSLKSTYGNIFHNPFEYILADYTEHVECSNGEIYVVDELKHKPWDSWHTEIKVEAEDINALVVDTLLEKSAIIYRRELPSSDSLSAKISGGRYLEVVDKNPAAKSHPILIFNVWDILGSTKNIGDKRVVKYDLKVVFLPQEKATSKNKTILPNLVSLESKMFDPELDFESVGSRALNDPVKLDTVLIGTIKPDFCSYGTNSPGVQLKITNGWTKNALNKKKYSTTLLIDCIILEPSKE